MALWGTMNIFSLLLIFPFLFFRFFTAMEKRIAFGGCDLPRQRCSQDEVRLVHSHPSILILKCLLNHFLESFQTPSYVNTLKAQKVDPLAVEAESSITNVWSDMEVCDANDYYTSI